MDDVIERNFKIILEEGLGLEISNPNLLDTPKRVSKMYKEMFKGLYLDPPNITVFPNEKNYDEIVLLDNIHYVSMCSHHFLPFTGKAWVAYIPDKFVMGASKPARVIDHFASKPQLQENLCHEVIEYIEEAIKPKALLVMMRGIHGCMVCRGVRQYDNSGMVTSAIKGVFRDNISAKQEALDLIRISMVPL